VLNTSSSYRSAPTTPLKSRNPAPSLSGNLPFSMCQETCFPKRQKGQCFPLWQTMGEPLLLS
jgi:hypothetical protein